MLFSFSSIRSLMFSEYYFHDACVFYKRDLARSLVAYKKGGHVVVEAGFASPYYYRENAQYKASVEFDFENNSFTSNCDCYKRVNTGTICEHCAAIFLYCNEIDMDNLPFNYEKHRRDLVRKRDQLYEKLSNYDLKEEYFNQTTELLKQNTTSYKPTNPITEGPIYMSMEMLETPYDYELSFKVGKEKPYAVKSIRNFLEKIDRKQVYSYGKKLTFDHSFNSFDKTAQSIIELMRSMLSYCYPEERPKNFLVTRHNIASIYQAASQLPSELSNIVTEVKNEPIVMEVKKDDEGDYYINKQYEDLGYCGPNGCYEIQGINEGNRSLEPTSFLITKNECTSSEKFYKLFEYFQENHTLYINRNQLASFYNSFVKPLSGKVIFKNFPEIGEQFEEKAALYGRVNEEDNIDFGLRLFYKDGSEKWATQVESDHYSQMVSQIINTFLDYKASISEDKASLILDPDKTQTKTFMTSILPLINKDIDVYLENSLLNYGKKSNHSIKVGLTFNNDLLQINLSSVDIPGEELADVLRAYRRKKRFYRLKDGDTISLYSDDLEELDNLLNNYDIDVKNMEDGSIEVNPFRAFALDKENNSNLVVERNKLFTNYLENFNNVEDDNFVIDAKYDGILRDYQRFGVEWMHHLNKIGFCGILADDMGLGKTVEVLALLESEHAGKSLVVCPSSLILNWADEASKFNSGLKVVPIYGSKQTREQLINESKNADLLITSYDYMRNDVDLYSKIKFDTIILDEAQYIKNHSTKNANSVKKLKSKHRFALTGTPIENSLAELWSIFDFLMPGYLFSYNYFKRNYESEIINRSNEEVPRRLKNMVSPFILRRNKKDVLTELPDKEEHTIYVDFTSEERKIYLANLMQANKMLQEELKAEHMDKIAILAMITKLRQLCLDDRLVYENVTEVSSKIQNCIDLLNTLKDNNKKVLLFSSFVSALTLIEKELIKNNISYHMLTGSSSKEERHEMVESFQNGDVDVFLISLKAGGTGLNLTKAEAVIHFDPWWNISAQNQATDRAYRIGQHNNVQVYSMIVKDSIEERIAKLQEMKKELSDTFVENNDGSLTRMSKEDLEKILSINY